MLDRLHTELLSLLPDETLRDSQYISLDHKGLYFYYVSSALSTITVTGGMKNLRENNRSA